MMDKAEKHFRRALLLEPQDPMIMNSLAVMLIESDLNINEGMELTENALGSYPDHFELLFTNLRISLRKYH